MTDIPEDPTPEQVQRLIDACPEAAQTADDERPSAGHRGALASSGVVAPAESGTARILLSEWQSVHALLPQFLRAETADLNDRTLAVLTAHIDGSEAGGTMEP
jgi:hypothetical protein